MIFEPRDCFEVNTPLGDGRVLFVECTGHDYYWTIALNDTRAVVTFTQDKLRMQRHYTHGRDFPHEAMRKVIAL